MKSRRYVGIALPRAASAFGGVVLSSDGRCHHFNALASAQAVGSLKDSFLWAVKTMFSLRPSAMTAPTGSLQVELKSVCKVHHNLAFFSPSQIHVHVWESLLHQVGLAFWKGGSNNMTYKGLKPTSSFTWTRHNKLQLLQKTSLEIRSVSGSIHQPLPLLTVPLRQLSQAPGFVAFKQFHVNPKQQLPREAKKA